MKVGRGEYTVKFISDAELCKGQLGILTHLTVANVCYYLQKNPYIMTCLFIQAST